MDKIQQLEWIALEHPTYSPDLAPSDFWVFRKLKKHMRGKVHRSKTELTDAVRAFFQQQPAN